MLFEARQRGDETIDESRAEAPGRPLFEFAQVQFEPNGELKNPATTLFTYKGGQKTAID